MINNSSPCIGLFGTCGGSKWRDAFIAKYSDQGIHFFNPNKDVWTPKDADIEADHLVNDDVILFPITSETFGTGSLAETGYSILSAIHANSQRYVVIFIDSKVDSHLWDTEPAAAKESTNSRAIVLAHLRKVAYPSVYIVQSLEEMLELSLSLYTIVEAVKTINLKYRKNL